MKKLLVLLALVAAPRMAHAQDVMKVAPNHYKVLAENQYVRVVQNTLQPGEKDDWHSHPAGWTYVTQGGTMKVTWKKDGKVEMWTPKTGDQGWGEAEQAHTSENVGDKPMSYVLVEIKVPSKK